ncbi:MAG: tetratricopeptide repeat protein [Peptococcaceae bacterium]|nr:tetratricopeptide repeat protein [Peptococcaceae bacterium]
MDDYIQRLEEKGRKYLEGGDYGKAVKTFNKALAIRENHVIRNNLAMAHYLAGDYDTCLRSLQLNLADGAIPNPYAHSLACLALVKTGQLRAARTQLEKAIKEMDEGTRALARSGKPLAPWNEYAVIVLRAAGALQDHRLVCELYNKWRDRQSNWESAYFGGVAAFNLKKYRQAASCWASIANVWRPFMTMQRVAVLADRGNIPHFTLEYVHFDQDKIMKMAEGALDDPVKMRQMISDSTVRLFYLTIILEEEMDIKLRKLFLSYIIRYGGEWGCRLGKDWLLSPAINDELKITAAMALVENGVLQPGEPVQMYIDNQQREVYLREYIFSPETEAKMAQVYEKAMNLARGGKVKEAARLLEVPLLEEGNAYPPAMILLVRLYHNQGEEKKKQQLIDMLESFSENMDDLKLHFEMAYMYLDIEEIDKAVKHVAAIESKRPPAENKEFEKMLSELLMKIYMENEINVYSDFMIQEYRRQVEDKRLAISPSLTQGMKNMPANWLSAACQSYSLAPARLRNDRERQITALLQEEENLQKIIQGMEPTGQELLRYLLQREGWSRINTLTRKFGSMDDDGFYWEDEPPVSTLGRLWLRCLIFIGRAKINGRNTKIAAVPNELRPALCRLLS